MKIFVIKVHEQHCLVCQQLTKKNIFFGRLLFLALYAARTVPNNVRMYMLQEKAGKNKKQKPKLKNSGIVMRTLPLSTGYRY